MQRRKGVVFLVHMALSVNCFVGTLLHGSELPDVVRICNDAAEWPPFGYIDPENKEHIIGASTDILREIFNRQNLKIDIKLLPWKRCQSSVESGEYQILYDASRNLEREAKYHLSKPMYSIRHAFYYSRSKFPDGLEMKSVKDVERFSIGGVFGYNFGVYSFDISRVDQGSKTTEALLTKLGSPGGQ